LIVDVKIRDVDNLIIQLTIQLSDDKSSRREEKEKIYSDNTIYRQRE